MAPYPVTSMPLRVMLRLPRSSLLSPPLALRKYGSTVTSGITFTGTRIPSSDPVPLSSWATGMLAPPNTPTATLTAPAGNAQQVTARATIHTESLFMGQPSSLP